MNTLGPTFYARFDSECTECGNDVWEGDLAGFMDDQFVCDACWNEADLDNERELMALSGVEPGLLPGEAALPPFLQAIVDRAKAVMAAEAAGEPVPTPPAAVEPEPPAAAPEAPAIDVAALIAAGQAKLAAEAPAAPAVDVAALIAAGQAKLAAVSVSALGGEDTIDVAALIAAGKARIQEADAAQRAEAAGWTGTPQVDPWHAAEDPDPWSPNTKLEQWPPPEAADKAAAIFEEMLADDEARTQADLLLKAQEIPEEPFDRLEFALDQLAPYRGAQDPDKTVGQAMDVVYDAIVNHPRSLQVEIGPSEIGTECDHCLAAKLAGWKQQRGAAWLPTIGTAVHSWLEQQFRRRMAALPPRERRWLVEAKVYCGEIAGVPITGSTDLLDLWYGMTGDWKLVGTTTLKEAKRIGASPVYRTQQQIYAHGWNMAGVKVTDCAIMYLPRNAMSLQDAYPVHEPYDPDVALGAFERANNVAAWLQGMAHLPVEQRDAFISLLPRKRDPKTGQIDCYDCKRFGDFPDAEKTQLDPSMGGLVDLDD